MGWIVVYSYIVITVQLLTVICHSCGFYLLKCLRRQGHTDVQIILVMNLSVTEILLNMSYIILFVLKISVTMNSMKSISDIVHYIDIISAVFVNFNYYMTMIYIALNKMLQVFLNIKYSLFCRTSNVKYLLAATWLTSLSLCSIVLGADTIEGFNFHKTVKYFYTSFDFLFIAIFVVSHTYIFSQYRHACSMPPHCSTTRNRNHKRKKQGVWKTFRASRFYLSCVLIITFTFLTIIPKLVALFVFPYIKNDHVTIACGILIGLFYHVSFLVDALIYVFMDRAVWLLLRKKMKKSGLLRRLKRRKEDVFAQIELQTPIARTLSSLTHSASIV